MLSYFVMLNVGAVAGGVFAWVLFGVWAKRDRRV